MPFVKTGLSAAMVLSLRSPGVLKLMGILNMIGVNRQGFSLLLCSRIYSTFVRPKFEYGLAISKFSAAQAKTIDQLQDKCLRMMVGGHATSSTCAYYSLLPSGQNASSLLSVVASNYYASNHSSVGPPQEKSSLPRSAISTSCFR
ncbi:hypothetical protein G6F56_013976 [Rhizopus delemar]|nr:hypothetical protein G6F56_013976 [Rhizopus delemar]